MSKILIVDDKEENRYLLHTILTASGHETRDAANGAEALESARRERPDLIVSDILMPQMDGFALCRECKRDETLRDIPFIFYTATYTDPRDRDFGLQLGAVRFLVKPMEAGDLSALIAEVLKEHAQQKLSAPPPHAEDETTIYRLYNEALVRKLEDKMLALEETNRALQSEVVERERLADERSRQMQVLEASLNEIYMFAADSLRFTYVNLGARKNLGYTMDELLRLTPLDIKPEFTLEKFRGMLRPLLSHQEEVYVFETLHRRKDGTLYPAEVHLQLVGALFVAIIHDISERKRAEQGLKESEERFASAFNASPVGITITTLEEGRILDVNPSFLDFSGYTREEVIGRASLELNLWANPADREKITAALRRDGRAHDLEVQIRAKSGAILDILASIELITVENKRCMLWVVHDITARKRAEEQIKFQAHLLSVVGNAVIATDMQGQVTYWNPAAEKLYGWSAEEALGRQIVELTPAEQTREQAQEIMAQLAQGKPWSGEFTVRRKDGNEFPAFVFDTPIVDEGGNLTGVIGVSNDVSERKRAQERERFLTRLYATLSQVNQTIVRVKDCDELLQSICRIAVEFGQFNLAWIGRFDSEKGEVTLSAAHGAAEERLPRQPINLNESPYKEGLMGRAVRSGYIAYSRDVQTDLTVQHLRELAAASGFHAAAAIPIHAGGGLFGLLNLYAADIDFFNDEAQQSLLTEMALDIGFALDMMALERQHARAEAQVEANERRFRAMTEKTSDTIVLLDGEGKLIYRSASGAGLFGYSDEEVLGRNAIELIHPDDLPRVTELFAQFAGRPGESRTAEFRYQHKNGNWLHVETSATNLLNDPDVGAIVVNYRDISERKRAEEALHQSEERFRLISSVTSDYMFSTGLEADGQLRLNWVAGAFENITGYTMEEFVARGGWRATLHPEDLAVDDRDMALLRAGQRIVSELRTLTKAGELCWVRSYAHPVLDPHSGELASIYGAVQDITARKRAEERIRRQIDELQTIHQISQRFARLQSLTELAEEIIATLAQNLNYSFCAILLLDETGQALYPYAVSDQNQGKAFTEADRAYIASHGFHLGKGIVGWVAQHGQSVRTGDAQHDPRYYALRSDIQSELCVPLWLGDRVIGVINVEDTRPDAFTESDERVLGTAAAHIAVAIQNARLLQQLQQELAARRAAEEHYRLLVENIPAVVYRDGADDDATSYLNPQVEALLGYAPAAYQEDATLWNKQVDPRDYEIAAGSIRETLAQGKAEAEYRMLARDGRRVWVHDSSVLIRDASGAPQFILGFMEDISERKQREQELEAVARIAAALRTAETVEELLTSLLDETLALFGTDSGSIRLYHPGAGVLYNALARGWFEPLRATVIRPGEGIVGAVFSSGQAHISREFTSDPLALPESKTKIPPGWGGICVPLPAAAEVVGAMFIGVPLPRQITAAEARLLSSLAEIAGSALHRLRLHEETVRSLQQLIALRTIDQAISSSLDLKETLEVLVSQAAARLQMDAVAVLLLDLESQTLRYAAGHGFRTAGITQTRLRLGEGEAGRAALEQRTLTIANRQAIESVSARSELLAAEGFVAHHVAPMIIKGKVRGAIEVFHRGPFDPQEEWLSFFADLATQAAIALDNASLYQELQAHIAGLEARVAQRTAELEEANVQLRQAHAEVSRALQQERELHELKTRFTAMASHEFRTPLTVILSSAELLERYSHRFDEERRLTHLQRIEATAKRMTKLLDDMLLLGRADAGRLSFNPQPLNLVAFCRALVEETQLSMAAQHELALAVRTPDAESLPATLDEQLLRHILNNLLANAIKYSPPGSRVELTLHSEGEQAIMAVRDQGIGIPIEDQARLFEPFHRASNVGSTAGTGLGMNVAKRAVDMHGGVISVHSAENAGTTVVVTLPLRPPGHAAG